MLESEELFFSMLEAQIGISAEKALKMARVAVEPTFVSSDKPSGI
jgi:hypothetical protein